MSSVERKFQPGDIVRVVRYPSKEWICSGPVRVTGHHSPSAIWVETMQGRDAGIDGFRSYCIEDDCELDTFLDTAQKAIRDAE